MQLSDIGEFGLINTMISPAFKALVKNGFTGIGDDCAVIPHNENEYLVVTTDMLVEEVHFLSDKISAYDLGFKSLAVNLSDIAAMGAKPTGSFLSIAFPKTQDTNWIEAFLKGYKALSAKEDTPLLGGDTTKSTGSIVLNVAVIGQVARNRIKYRSAAQSGDLICVSDNLGDSAGGLEFILNDLPQDELAKQLLAQHYHPYPKINEGKFLGQFPEVHAMLDISDGISSDLNHILKASGARAELWLERIPLSEALQTKAKQYNWNLYELALAGGEDYSLLFTVAPESYERIADKFKHVFNRPLHAIGCIREGTPEITYYENGKPTDPLKTGYSHF